MSQCQFTDGKITGYHFTQCGLDYVYLLNGYELEEDPDYGTLFSLHDSDALHREIASNIVLHKKTLTWQEMRFLRKEIGLTQEDMAHYLSKSLRQYQRYEQKGEPVPGEIQSLMRILYWDYHVKTPSIIEMLEELEKSKDSDQQLYMQLNSDGWKVAA